MKDAMPTLEAREIPVPIRRAEPLSKNWKSFSPIAKRPGVVTALRRQSQRSFGYRDYRPELPNLNLA